MSRIRFLSLPILALAALLLGAPRAHADSHQVIGETSITVPAGGEASIDVQAFCLEFGEPFPESVGAPSASAEVQKLLKSAISQGAHENEVLQTQLAVWQTIEGEWGYDEGDVDLSVAESLIATAEDADTSPLTGRGTALDEAIEAGKVEVTIEDWEQVDAETVFASDAPYYGEGRVVITNLGDEDLDIYYPVGMVLPSADEAQQDMGSVAVEMQEVEKAPELPKTGAADQMPLILALAGLAFTGIGFYARRRTAVGI